MFKHPLLYVWIVLVAMFVAAGFMRPATEGSFITQTSTKSEGSKHSEARAEQTPAAEQGEAEVYSPNCERPKDHDQADLCVQQRMADAAERQNTINSWALAALVATLMATFVAAVAAWLTVRTMRETAKRELRAYINLDTTKAIAENGQFKLELLFKNYGQTPAHNVTAISARQLHEVPRYGGLDLPDKARLFSAGTIGPGSNLTMEGAAPTLTDDHRAQLARVKLAVFYFGRIEYSDVFGDPHVTDFCHMLTDTNISNGEVDLLVHSSGNDAT